MRAKYPGDHCWRKERPPILPREKLCERIRDLITDLEAAGKMEESPSLLAACSVRSTSAGAQVPSPGARQSSPARSRAAPPRSLSHKDRPSSPVADAALGGN